MNRTRLTVLLVVLAAAPLAQAQTTLLAPIPEAAPFPPPVVSSPVDGGAANPPLGGAVWVDAEYLLWWMRGQALPPLATASPSGTANTAAGVIGVPGTVVLIGNTEVNNVARSGGRIVFGAWLDGNQTMGVEADCFDMANNSKELKVSSNGTLILSRPFINAVTGTNAAVQIAFPGDLTGSVQTSAFNEGLIGAGLLLRESLGRGDNFSVDLVGGYRYFHFTDRLGISSSLTSINPASPTFVVPGTEVALADQFDTQNTFNGFELGLVGKYCSGPFDLQVVAKVAAGLNQEGVDIFGATNVLVPGAAPTHSAGGLLALSSNIGHYSKNEGSVIPEFSCKVGYQLTENVRATIGYTLLIWDDVVRAGNQIDRGVNPTLVPGFSGTVTGPLNPAFSFQQTNLWVQGLTLGLELKF
jgi:Putative beta barrel porin-7 (BBP7)